MYNEILNPKYNSKDDTFIYKYYAGFSTDFVKSILKVKNVEKLSILDPWNGSGTTTRVAAEEGAKLINGFDINPVMVVVSTAETLDKKEYRDVEFHTIRYLFNKDVYNDPLASWFTRSSVRNIRNVEMEFRSKLLKENNLESHLIVENEKGLETLTNNKILSFYYLVLFETIKKHTVKFKSSNPTWIKTAKTQEEKIKITQKEFEKKFREELILKKQMLENKKRLKTHDINHHVGDSRRLSIEESTVDLIITSPPYCTRVDYTISTRIELAVLGVREGVDLECLRKNMIGTTKVLKKSLDDFEDSSITAKKFISDVKNHESKASKSYYQYQFRQYFESINESILELIRVCKDTAEIYIVVQDSYYKEVYLNLAKVFEELFGSYKWELRHRKDFYKKQTIVSLNRNTKNYRKVTSPIESVLIFGRSLNNYE